MIFYLKTQPPLQGGGIKTNVTGVKHDGIRQLHDLLANLLSKWLHRAKITNMGGVGGYRRTCKGLFTEICNLLPKLDPNNPVHAEDLRFRKGIIPDPRRSTSPRMLLKCSETVLLPT